MLDNELITLFRTIITDGLTGVPVDPVPDIVQAYQPTTQGTPLNSTVFFYKVSDHRYGSPKWLNTYDADSGVEIHQEIQAYETVFQFNALAIQNPNTVSFTASDLVNLVSQILQSERSIRTLESNNVSLLRITDVRNPYFTDDFERYEASPSFDVTFTHTRTLTTTVPVIVPPVAAGIHRI